MNEFIFTFGFGQKHENGFHAIRAENWGEARRIMFDRFGAKWSMQYESRDRAGVDRYRLKEIEWQGNDTKNQQEAKPE